MKTLFALIASLVFSAAALAGGNIGDYDASAVIYGKFTTYRPSTGANFTLAGTPAISVYKDNSTTQSTTGVTLTADFDAVTGLNHFAIDTSADGTFYSAGSFFDIVITTGTVDSVSVVGSVVGSFTIRKTSPLKPTTAGRTVVVDAAGLVDANTVKLGPTGAGTAQTARDIGTSVLLSSGTGTGQLSLSSGAVLLQATQTGVTIPTVTNLTNTATSGDFTATQKTSIGTAVAASAVASVTGNVGGNVTGSVGSVATGGITAASIATDAIGAAEVAADVSTELLTGLANLSVNVAQVSGDSGVADRFEAMLDNTCAQYPEWGIARGSGTGCTAQSATSTTLVMDSSASFADDTAIGMTVEACGSTQGYCQSRVVTDSVSSTDTLTVDAWTVTPSGTITFTLYGTAPTSGAGGGGLDAAATRAALGMASANLDTQLASISTKVDTVDDFVDTEVAAIQTKTAFLPSATAGAAGGVFIAGTNAATTITTALTTTFTGNLSGSVGSVTGAVGSVTGAVGSVTGAVGSVTGAVGSVTGNVGGNVTGSVGSVATGGITAASIATDALGAAELAADAVTEIQSGLATSSALTSVASDVTSIKGFTDTEIASILAAVDTEVAAIKAKTDNMIFTISNQLDVNVESMNTHAVLGAGTAASPWNGE